MVTQRNRLYLGCTLFRARCLGVEAIVNARGGRQDLNDLTQEDIELRRDAQKILDHREHSVIIRQFNSKFLRRNRARVAHLLFDEEGQ